MPDYRQYHQLENYLFATVGPRFRRTGKLSEYDFFAIIIWKSNRSKSRVAQRLLNRGYEEIGAAVRDLAKSIKKAKTDQERMRILIEDWQLRLPIASAILTVLYPNRFTIYDVRVCNVLGDFKNIPNLTFKNLWVRYEKFITAVKARAPKRLTLRNKDRWLWGKSFYDDLREHLENNFQ